MEMILLDWTRMGKSFCLAGAVVADGGFRIVRPLQASGRHAPVRNVGWPAWAFEGCQRWEVFDLVHPEPAEPKPPHVEDLWVRGLRPHGRSAVPELRRAILEATALQTGDTAFGVPLDKTHTSLRLQPGIGTRSLVTLYVPAERIHFTVAQRDGLAGPDVRVQLDVPGPSGRFLAVKDHHLLRRAEQTATRLDDLARRLTDAITRMGAQVAVRLGLSRAHTAAGREIAWCWLMADGFFSVVDPQP